MLGPLEVLRDGVALEVGPRRHRALLALLVLSANRVVSADRLIEELWAGRPPDGAPKTLRSYVSRLRAAIGDDVVRSRTPGYLLEIDPDRLDARRFERLLDEGRRARARGDAAGAAASLRAGLALWHGEALADLADEPFAEVEARRLEELRLVAIEERIEADLDCGRHHEIVAELEKLLDEQPLRERLWGQLMTALYRSGRQAQALEAYRDARRALTEELGIEPGRELKELEARILQQDARLDLAPIPEEPGHEVDVGGAPFVGREAELERLNAGLDAAITGRGGLFLLVGEPGIGKSRLAEEITRLARARGAGVLLGRCWEAGGAPAYWPWVQSIRAYVKRADPAAVKSQLAGGAADVAQIVPELRDLFPDLPEPHLETEGARFRLFDSAARFLRNAAEARPLVIVLDDLHAADEPSLLLLRFVAGELAESRILIIGTYRDVDPTVHDPLASALAELAREQVTHRTELSGLTEADVAQYIELASGEAPHEDSSRRSTWRPREIRSSWARSRGCSRPKAASRTSMEGSSGRLGYRRAFAR